MYDQWMDEGPRTHTKRGNTQRTSIKTSCSVNFETLVGSWQSDYYQIISLLCFVNTEWWEGGRQNCVFQTWKTTELWLRTFESCNGWSSLRACWSLNWIGHQKWSRSGYWFGQRRRWRRWYWVSIKKTTTLSCVYFSSLFLFVNKCSLAYS